MVAYSSVRAGGGPRAGWGTRVGMWIQAAQEKQNLREENRSPWEPREGMKEGSGDGRSSSRERKGLKSQLEPSSSHYILMVFEDTSLSSTCKIIRISLTLHFRTKRKIASRGAYLLATAALTLDYREGDAGGRLICCL